MDNIVLEHQGPVLTKSLLFEQALWDMEWAILQRQVSIDFK